MKGSNISEHIMPSPLSERVGEAIWWVEKAYMRILYATESYGILSQKK